MFQRHGYFGSSLHWLLLLHMACWLAVTTDVRCETSPRVVIVSSPGHRWIDVEQRLRGELGSAGFTILTASRPLPDDDAVLPSLRAIAEARGAVAAIWTLTEPRAVRVWGAISATGGPYATRFEPLANDAESAGVVAMQVAETLHAARQKLMSRRAAIAAPAQKPKPEIVRRRFGVFAGPGVSFGPGGVGAQLHFAVGGCWAPWETFGFDGDVAAAVAGGSFTRSGAEAQALANSVRGHLAWRPAWDQVSPFVGLGGGLAWVSGEADLTAANTALKAQSDSIRVGVLSTRIGAVVALHDELRLRLSSTWMLLFPAVNLNFEGKARATLGRPLAELGAALEWTWAP